jgi:DNA-binding transcriptional ArsR family regulator
LAHSTAARSFVRLILALLSHRIATLCFIAAVLLAAFLFGQRPPRAQAHLAALEEAVSATLKEVPRGGRIYFANSAGEESYVWCRYFAAPLLLLDSEASTGDTVLWVQKPASGESLPKSGYRALADHNVGGFRATLFIRK